jgi:hypothetical protein
MLINAVREQQRIIERQGAQIVELQSGRRVIAGLDLNGIGFAVGGLALAGALVFTRRKRSEGGA